MAAPIYNPMVPCVHPIPGGMYPGSMIRVTGFVPHGAERFAINLQCGPQTDPRDDIALHINVRFPEMCIVRNNLSSYQWGSEDTSGGQPIQPGTNFEVLLLCEPNAFKMAVNGNHFCEFGHRVPTQRITHITVDGDVQLQLIAFEGAQMGPGSYNVPQMNTAPPPAYSAPAYGGFY